jgi:hypothetical protein
MGKIGRLTTKARPLVGYHADGNEPANADAVVRSRSFEERLERGEAEGLPY